MEPNYHGKQTKSVHQICCFILEKLCFPEVMLLLSSLLAPDFCYKNGKEKNLKDILYFPHSCLPSPPLLRLAQACWVMPCILRLPMAPHSCQLVTERSWDSCLTALAKQEKWSQQGARGLPSFFHKKYLSQQGFVTAAPAPYLHTSIHICACILCLIVRTFGTGQNQLKKCWRAEIKLF